jgi:hypothetical protein
VKIAQTAPHITFVSLSRRNLVALLAALDDPFGQGSATLRKRLHEDAPDMLFVVAEEDDDHYAEEATA